MVHETVSSNRTPVASDLGPHPLSMSHKQRTQCLYGLNACSITLFEVYTYAGNTAMITISFHKTTVVPTKSHSDVIFCLQLLSKTLTSTPHLS